MYTHMKSARKVALAGIILLFLAGAAYAHNCHLGGRNNAQKEAPKSKGTQHSHMMSMKDRPVQKAEVDGMLITLDVMDMGMHVHMQEMKKFHLPETFDSKKSQAIMVMLMCLETKEAVSDNTVTVTIVDPSGEAKTSNAPWYGDHYGESFSPSKGTYKIKVKAVNRNGKVREAAFPYEKI